MIMPGQLASKIKQKIRKHKVKTIVIVILASLIAVNIITYMIWADNQLPNDVSSWLPPYVHWYGPQFEFACVPKAGWKALSAKQQQRLLEIFRSEFETLYFDKKDIPSERWLHDPEHPSYKTGLNRGCILDWRFKKRFVLLKADYSDWEGLLAASHTRVTYVWFFGRWIRLWRSATIVS